MVRRRFTANTTGASVIQGAKIQAVSDAAWTATGDSPTRLEFYTAPDGSASAAERLRITSSGSVQIAANGNLYVVGGGSYNASLNGNILSFDRAGYSYIDQTSNSGTLVFRVGSSSANMLRLDTSNAYFPNGTLFLGTQNTSSGHINAYENMSFNIDSDNDDTNRYFSFHTNGSSASGTELLRINEYGGLKLFNSSSNISGTDTGALFYNTLEKRVKVYNGNAWTNTDIASDPYWSNVVLLIQGASTITDAAGRHTLSLNGNAQTSTNHTSPVGNSHTIRICSSNAGDYLNVQSNLGDFRLDDSDWTFEYWVRIVDTSTSYYHVFTADGQNNRGTFKGYSPGSSITSMYFYSSQGNGLSHGTNSSFAHNAWMHVAWEFDDSADDFRLYIGGVLKETNTSMTFQGGDPSYAYFGRNTDQTNESLEFYIDNIRWTRGVCRYNGSNFTPPTSPYPTS